MSVVLDSSDGDAFQVDYDAAKMIMSISQQLDDDTERSFAFPNIKSSVLENVVKFITHHKDNEMAEIPRPLRSSDIYDSVSEWDANFISALDQENVFELILAANTLEIKSLVDLACAQVASWIKGKTTEEIRETFNITNDFTPEEEEQIRQENLWAEDA